MLQLYLIKKNIIFEYYVDEKDKWTKNHLYSLYYLQLKLFRYLINIIDFIWKYNE